MHDFTGGPKTPSNNGNSSNNNNSSGNNGGMPPGIIMPSMPSGFGQPTDVLEYVINYNDKFANTGVTLFRDNIVEQVLSVLSSKNKPNALLVGAAGVGKTKIVEDIAYRIAHNDPIIPEKLKNATVYELPLSWLVAGSGIVGELESRLKDILAFMEDPKNNAIMFIDEIHIICDSHSNTYDKIAQLLKPALARGKVRVIGATTLQESRMLNTDPAFNRRFSRLIVDEFTKSQTVEILKQAKVGFFNHYSNKVLIDDDLLESVVNIADRFTYAGSHRPDNALTLLDRACADAVINRKKAEINAQNDPVILAAIKANPMVILTENQVKNTAQRLITGNAEKENFSVDALTENLSVIKGQDDVLKPVIELIKRDDRGLYERTKPLALMFAGPSGVGKTEVTKIIAQTMTSGKPIILNMTEYHSPASINRIIGSPAGYVGYDSNVELPFDCLESNPYQVILLDEFEKCDKSVQALFMSALEEGNIKTSAGKLIDFSKATIIATTNAASIKPQNTLGFTNTSSKKRSRDALTADLSKIFITELLNRFDHIYEFNPINKETYRDIVAQTYHNDITRIKREHRRITLPDYLPDDTLDKIVDESYAEQFGARPAGKAVREYIEENA